VHLIIATAIRPTLHKRHIGSSDPKGYFPSRENKLSGEWSYLKSDNAFDGIGSSEREGSFRPWKTLSLKDAPSISPTRIFIRRIIRLLWSDSPTLGSSDYPNPLSFPISCFLTWIRFDSWFFQLPSVFLIFIEGLELILSKCAWTLRPMLALLSLNELLRKCTETDVAFTLEYSRVSNPRRTIKHDQI